MTKQKLIEDNMNLVYVLVSREYPAHIHDEDIIQSGMVGLCKAANLWDETKATFSGFAWMCIRHEIINEFKRRAKHQGVLSLDYEIYTNGSKGTLGETLVGDEDVCYIDDYSDRLTPTQQNIVKLLKTGMSPADVAKKIGVTKSAVSFTRRKLRILRSQADRGE